MRTATMTVLGELEFEPELTNLPEPLRLRGLTYGQVAAIRLEVEALAKDMKGLGAHNVVTIT